MTVTWLAVGATLLIIAAAARAVGAARPSPSGRFWRESAAAAMFSCGVVTSTALWCADGISLLLAVVGSVLLAAGVAAAVMDLMVDDR